MENPKKLKVEAWSDVVCPFCYIGKRQYEKALSQFADADDLELEFKSYQLDPGFVQDPDKKTDMKTNLMKKYGRTAEQVDQMLEGITASAAQSGLEYRLEDAVSFNTFEAHRVQKLAKEKGLGSAVEEAFFKAYFTEGKDLGNKEVLTTTAEAAGLTAEEVNRALTEEKYAELVREDIAEASKLGVNGVPFFVFDRKYAVSGAQPVEVFLNTMKAVHDEWSKENAPKFKMADSSGASCDIDGNCD